MATHNYNSSTVALRVPRTHEVRNLDEPIGCYTPFSMVCSVSSRLYTQLRQVGNPNASIEYSDWRVRHVEIHIAPQ
jgi:hypothetical protein